MGQDGHIAGITPHTQFDSKTHIGKMTEHFKDLVLSSFNERKRIPDELVTVGIKTIMNSKKIIVMISGKRKQEIVEKAFFGPITEKVPASILQLHPNTKVYLDNDAAGLIKGELK